MFGSGNIYRQINVAGRDSAEEKTIIVVYLLFLFFGSLFKRGDWILLLPLPEYMWKCPTLLALGFSAEWTAVFLQPYNTCMYLIRKDESEFLSFVNSSNLSYWNMGLLLNYFPGVFLNCSLSHFIRHSLTNNPFHRKHNNVLFLVFKYIISIS